MNVFAITENNTQTQREREMKFMYLQRLSKGLATNNKVHGSEDLSLTRSNQ